MMGEVVFQYFQFLLPWQPLSLATLEMVYGHFLAISIFPPVAMENRRHGNKKLKY